MVGWRRKCRCAVDVGGSVLEAIVCARVFAEVLLASPSRDVKKVEVFFVRFP